MDITKINTNNYAEFFLDYFEGRLNEFEIDVLNAFLEKNPDLKSEFEDGISFNLPDESLLFSYKSTLHKSNKDYLELLVIKEIENDLDKNQKEKINNLKGDKEFDKIKKQYQKTILKPDFSIKYLDKNKIKQKEKILLNKTLWFSLAASLLLLIALFFIIENPRNEKVNIVNKNSDNEIENNVVENSNENIVTTEVIEKSENNHNLIAEVKQEKNIANNTQINNELNQKETNPAVVESQIIADKEVPEFNQLADIENVQSIDIKLLDNNEDIAFIMFLNSAYRQSFYNTINLNQNSVLLSESINNKDNNTFFNAAKKLTNNLLSSVFKNNISSSELKNIANRDIYNFEDKKLAPNFYYATNSDDEVKAFYFSTPIISIYKSKK